MRLQNFNEFLNENITPEQIKKVENDAIKWANSRDIKTEIYVPSIRRSEELTIYFRTKYSRWGLSYEPTAKKYVDPYSRSHGQSYKTDDTNLKWYIILPVESSRYDYRSNKRSGNLASIKNLLNMYLDIEKTLIKVSDFLNLLGIEHKIKITKYYIERNSIYVTIDLSHGAQLEILKDTKQAGVSWKLRNKSGLGNIDHEKGDIFYVLADMLYDYDTSDENTMLPINVLEILRDKSVEDVWNKIKNCTSEDKWKEVFHAIRGLSAGKKFNF
jgi:hypothetical protein